MEISTIIGFVAGFASMTSFTPQAWKVVKSRRTEGLSAKMYSVTVFGFALWFTYGLLRNEWPIIVTNGVCLILSAFILMMILLPRAKKNAVADALDLTAKSGNTESV